MMMMMIKKPTKVFVLFSLGFIVIITAAIAIIQSEIVANSFISNLHSSANHLRTSMKELEKSVDSPLLDNPTAPPAALQAEVKATKDAIAECRKRLNDLSVSSSKLRPLHYPAYIGTYARATTMQERTQFAVSQTNDTLDRYEDTIAFIEAYASSLATTAAVMNEFNTIADFNAYAGNGEHFRRMAATIRTSADTITTTVAPTELMTLKTDTVDILHQLSVHMNSLAYGMDIAVDDTIYGSVKQIEDAHGKLNTITEQTFADTAARLRVVENIYGLDEKLDFILG